MGTRIALIHDECDRQLIDQATALAAGADILPIEIATGRAFDAASIDRPIVVALASRAALSDPAFVDAIDALRGAPLHIALTEVPEVPLGVGAMLIDARPPRRIDGIDAEAAHFAALLTDLALGRSRPQLMSTDRLYSEETRRRIVADHRSKSIAGVAVAASLPALPVMIYAGFENSLVVESEGMVQDAIGMALMASLLLILPAASILINEHSWALGNRTAIYRPHTGRAYLIHALSRTIALGGVAALLAVGLWTEFTQRPDSVELLSRAWLGAMIVTVAGSLLIAACLSAAIAFLVKTPRRVLAWLRRDQIMRVTL